MGHSQPPKACPDPPCAPNFPLRAGQTQATSWPPVWTRHLPIPAPADHPVTFCSVLVLNLLPEKNAALSLLRMCPSVQQHADVSKLALLTATTAGTPPAGARHCATACGGGAGTKAGCAGGCGIRLLGRHGPAMGPARTGLRLRAFRAVSRLGQPTV